MNLTSTDVADGGPLALRHGKTFENISPHLTWSEVPPQTASLVLTLIDTHPVARGYVHWFVDRLPPHDGELPNGAGGNVPIGRELTPYAGPFPPSGTHDYVFTLYALDAAAADLSATASVADFLAESKGHVVTTATLTGRFTKPAS